MFLAKLRTADARTALDRALSGSRGAFCAVGLFSFCVNALLLAVPVYMLHVYDRVLTARSENTLLMLTIVTVGLMLTLGVLELARSRVLVRVGNRLDSHLARPLFAAMLAEQLGGRGGSRSQPVRDLEAVRTFLTGAGLLALFDLPWTPLFVALVFMLHPLLGWVAVLGALILFGLAALNELLTRLPLGEASRDAVRAASFAETSLRNAEAIQAMGMGAGLLQRWLHRHHGALGRQALASDRAAAIAAAAKVVRQLLQVGVLAVGAYLAIRQVTTAGVMIAASIITARALAPVETAIASWRAFVSARSAYARLQALLAGAAGCAPPMKLPRPVGELALEQVVAAPPGIDKPLIHGISFRLARGESLGIIGPSAAGKSTLARLIVGVWRPTAGHVRLDGADVHRWDADELGPSIGYLPQDVELFDGTVHENIARFGALDEDGVVAAARMAGVHEMILRLAAGYDTRIGEGGSVLSGGQRQRIALARALYGNPALIVLDEPNANLDGEGEEALCSAIAELKRAGRTVVLIAHRPSIVRGLDKLLVLQDGRIALFGPTQEVMQRVVHGVAGNAGAAPQPAVRDLQAKG